MPSFQYQAYGSRGELVDGQIDAISAEAVETSLSVRGLTPFKIREASTLDVPWWRRELFVSTGVGRANLAAFTREFAELCSSGIPLDDCLRILADQATTEKMRAISTSLLASVLDGSSLADAVRKHQSIFPIDYLHIVHAGELAGALGSALEELAELMERRAAVEAKIKSALTYPAILIGLGAVSMSIVVGVLVPSITPIFAQNGKAPPDALRFLIWLQESDGALLFGVTTVLVLAGVVIAYIRRSPERRLWFDSCKLRLPLFRGFVLDGETARFARTLGTLLKAGVPLLQATASAQAVIRNRFISRKIERALVLLREGRSLTEALRSEEILPPVALRMISVGEESAKLDKMLLRTALMFENHTQRRLDSFMALLTPALTLLIAAMVGGLVLTVMNAILSVNQLAAG
jgi:general secretion pathway protein F